MHVHVWACVLLERMSVGKSSAVLIFRVGRILLSTTVKLRRTNKISELETWDISILKGFGTK